MTPTTRREARRRVGRTPSATNIRWEPTPHREQITVQRVRAAWLAAPGDVATDALALLALAAIEERDGLRVYLAGMHLQTIKADKERRELRERLVAVIDEAREWRRRAERTT